MECPCATAPAAKAAAQMSFDNFIAARLLDDLSLEELRRRNGLEVSSESKERKTKKIIEMHAHNENLIEMDRIKRVL